MWAIELFRSATFRLAILFALAVSVSSAIVFAFIYWQVATFDVERLNAILVGEVARAVTQPEDRLEREIELRFTSDLRRLDYAALFDQSLLEFPPNLGAFSQRNRIRPAVLIIGPDDLHDIHGSRLTLGPRFHQPQRPPHHYPPAREWLGEISIISHTPRFLTVPASRAASLRPWSCRRPLLAALLPDGRSSRHSSSRKSEYGRAPADATGSV